MDFREGEEGKEVVERTTLSLPSFALSCFESSSGTDSPSSTSFVCSRMKPPLPDSPLYDCSTETNTISLGTEHPNNKKRGGVTKGREQESEFTVGESTLGGCLWQIED